MNRRALFGFLGGALIAPYAIKRLPVPVELPAPVPQPDPGLSAKYSLTVDQNGMILGMNMMPPEHPNCRCHVIYADKFKILPASSKRCRAPGIYKIEAV